MKLRKGTEDDFPAMVGIWERSVRATHYFLAEEHFQKIRSLLADAYFPQVELTVCEVDGCPAGFIGTAGDMVEMLFVDPAIMGRGVGTALLEDAIRRGMRRVDVNEQNFQARDFYAARGFRTVGRDDRDASEWPYPILHLRR